jgi:signal transduction histidine kinase
LASGASYVLALVYLPCARDMMGAMSRSWRSGWWSWSAPVAFALALLVSLAVVLGPPRMPSLAQLGLETALLLPAVVTGCLIAARVPSSPVGGALAWMAAAPAGVLALERWGFAITPSHPWLGFVLTTAIWPWLFVGFVALVLVFPDGLLPGRRWRLVAWMAPAAALLLSAALSLDASSFAAEGGPVPGRSPISLPRPVRVAGLVAVFGLFFGVLVTAAASLATRFRRGDELTRLRVRWLMIAAGAVPILLAAGWVIVALGAPGEVAYEGFLSVMLLLVPAAVAVAVLRHDLFDVDRLLGEGLAWALTTLCSAGIFAVVVAGLAELFGRDSVIGVTGAAFATALCLLPLHRALVGVVGRLVDRERHVLLARVRQFVREVRDGSTEPEAVEDLLRGVLGDSSLRLLVRPPGEGERAALVDLRGARATVAATTPQVPLRTGDATVGLLALGNGSARRLRRAREFAVEARLPIEVSRLRLELRGALDDARASRTRLVAAGERERHRLERDLHDGAQQRLVAVGMLLRAVQRGLEGQAHAELDRAVDMLEETVKELRRLAHGVRPARLDDGLATALRSLAHSSGVPAEVRISDALTAEASDLAATTLYFVVAETLANAQKHARADQVHVSVERVGEVLHASIRDDGIGGAVDGFGLVSLRDRVAAAGGTLALNSPPGAGTEIRVELPCASS